MTFDFDLKRVQAISEEAKRRRLDGLVCPDAETGSSVAICLKVPERFVGKLIGSGGRSIKAVADAANVRMYVSQHRIQDERVANLYISGSEENVRKAKSQTVALVDTYNSPNSIENLSDGCGIDHLLLDDRFVGCVIGTQGKVLKDARSRFNVHVFVHKDADTQKQFLFIKGQKHLVADARLHFEKIILDASHKAGMVLPAIEAKFNPAFAEIINDQAIQACAYDEVEVHPTFNCEASVDKGASLPSTLTSADVTTGCRTRPFLEEPFSIPAMPSHNQMFPAMGCIGVPDVPESSSSQVVRPMIEHHQPLNVPNQAKPNPTLTTAACDVCPTESHLRSDTNAKKPVEEVRGDIPPHLQGIKLPFLAKDVFAVSLPEHQIDEQARKRTRAILQDKMMIMPADEFQKLVNEQVLKSAIHRFDVMSKKLLVKIPSPFRDHLKSHWESMVCAFEKKWIGQN